LGIGFDRRKFFPNGCGVQQFIEEMRIEAASKFSSRIAWCKNPGAASKSFDAKDTGSELQCFGTAPCKALKNLGFRESGSLN
jgi:hypothetical protein